MENTTFIPPALVERPDLLAEVAQLKCDSNLNWRGLEARTPHGGIGLSGSTLDRWSIVHFMACLERRRVETGSYQ